MSPVPLDADVARKLQEIGQPVDLCDPSGHVFGTFLPRLTESQIEYLTPGASEEELRRRETSGEKRYSLDEVLAYLEKL